MNFDHDANEWLAQSCRKTRAWSDKPQHKGPHVGVILAGVLVLALVVGVVLRVVL